MPKLLELPGLLLIIYRMFQMKEIKIKYYSLKYTVKSMEREGISRSELYMDPPSLITWRQNYSEIYISGYFGMGNKYFG